MWRASENNRVAVTSSIYLLDVCIQTGDTFVNERLGKDCRGAGCSSADANYIYIYINKKQPNKHMRAHTEPGSLTTNPGRQKQV